jgi:tRNA threonylcarbamoyladenosine biosynthesis protein TsaE
MKTAHLPKPLLFKSFPLVDADQTEQLGIRFADILRPGDVVLLHGQIGAGKTHFVRSIIQSRLKSVGQLEDVPSPTFTLVQVYDVASEEIWHADLYRLTSPSEVEELGLIDAFETAICLIEWPDRLGDLAPETALHIRLVLDGDGRNVTLEGDGNWALRLEGIDV